jgi:hypothetical protein
LTCGNNVIRDFQSKTAQSLAAALTVASPTLLGSQYRGSASLILPLLLRMPPINPRPYPRLELRIELR